jgi:hypothetical protein
MENGLDETAHYPHGVISHHIEASKKVGACWHWIAPPTGETAVFPSTQNFNAHELCINLATFLLAIPVDGRPAAMRYNYKGMRRQYCTLLLPLGICFNAKNFVNNHFASRKKDYSGAVHADGPL